VIAPADYARLISIQFTRVGVRRSSGSVWGMTERFMAFASAVPVTGHAEPSLFQRVLSRASASR
jgi:hypothetical protein